MNILIVTQHYWPENFRITDIAEALVSAGHKVTVLCGLPNYPKGYVFDDYKHGKNRKQEHNGVRILRVKEIGRRNNILFRFLNYWSYPFYGKKAVKKLPSDFDVVLINETSPIMAGEPAIRYGKRYDKPVLMYEMDLWPESLLAGGIKKGSFIYNHYKKVSSKIYSRCDKILVSSKEHIGYIKALPGCDKLDIDYLPQYAESVFEDGDFTNTNHETIDLMFAGNIGKAQSVDTIIRAAALLKDDPRFKFHILGDGSELENVKNLANGLGTKNVTFYGSRPLSEMPSFYKMADAMLVTLENKSYANMTVPGKMQSYIAAGKPVVGAVDGNCASFISDNGIGYVCPSEDHEALAKTIRSLTKEELLKVGEHAKRIYQERFSKAHFIGTLISNLEELEK